FTALAFVESRHRPPEALATQPRLRETAKGAARLGFERRYAARALAGAERRREFIRESLQRRCGVDECAPVRPRQRRRIMGLGIRQQRAGRALAPVARIRVAEHALIGARAPPAL